MHASHVLRRASCDPMGRARAGPRAMEGSNDQHGFADSIRAAERHGSRDNDRRCARSDNCMGYANRACRAAGERLKARQARFCG
ncbi:hypothetical protein BZM27_30820 [Paraburkholderia steynii]|uniref:Uncharacterized protein n=1 Tax=Paraburkholderia steynii TaxID=1245441 RepID=A0A4R0X6I3_9BURK|nr:hypothetical protein BZM27_30820 [Paraburkholderia steynii]